MQRSSDQDYSCKINRITLLIAIIKINRIITVYDACSNIWFKLIFYYSKAMYLSLAATQYFSVDLFSQYVYSPSKPVEKKQIKLLLRWFISQSPLQTYLLQGYLLVYHRIAYYTKLSKHFEYVLLTIECYTSSTISLYSFKAFRAKWEDKYSSHCFFSLRSIYSQKSIKMDNDV